jgi:hypothetical protein
MEIAPSERDERPQVLQLRECRKPVVTEKTTLKQHPGCVDDWPEPLALGVACMVRTWSSVSLRLRCESSGTNSSAEEQRTLVQRYKALRYHSSLTTGLTASCSFHRWEPISKLNFFLSFLFLCLKSLGLHSCAYLFKPFLFPRSEILPMCEIVLQVLQKSRTKKRTLHDFGGAKDPEEYSSASAW